MSVKTKPMNKELINRKLIYALLFIITTPFLVMLIFSFLTISGNWELNYSGFAELSKKVRIQELTSICTRSLLVCSIATIVSYLISYVLVLYTKARFQTFFLILITLPFFSNEAVRVFSWQHVLAENGLLNKFLGMFSGNTSVVFNSANGMNVYIIMIATCIPFSIFICTAALKTVPETYWKVSNDLKLNQFSKFIKVGLPMSKISIAASFIVTFFIAFALSSEVNFLGGSTKISTRGFILSLMSANQFQAIFVLGSLILITMVLLYVVFFLSARVKRIKAL